MIVCGADYYNKEISGYNRATGTRDVLIGYLEAGLPVNEILKTATWNAALALRKKGELGVIKEGAYADLVAFDGDLEKDFKKAITKVKLVIKNGVIVRNQK